MSHLSKEIGLTWSRWLAILAFLAAACAVANGQETKKPNLLVLWGDDIATTNISAYSDGLMGYTTPNIDRLANEGLRFLTTTASNRAPPGGRHSSRDSTAFAPG